ncbi:MAG: hypothetical protein MR536_07895 [Prevotella sp.]|nr:hypothetical protein [Prevotella sp.]
MINDNYFHSKDFLNRLKQYEDAITAGESVYMEPDELTDIAEYYHINNQLEQAVQAVNYALTLFPGSTLPLVFKARWELLKNNEAAKANEYAELIEDKSDLEYHYIKAEILIYNKDFATAEHYLQQTYETLDDEEKEDFAIDIAHLYADYGEHSYAEYWLHLSSDVTSPEYRELKGKLAMNAGNYEECEEIFQSLLDEDPYSNPYWNQLASSQFMHNNIIGSIESSEFSIAINPDDEEALLNKANGMFSLGRFEEALKYYKRFSELHQIDETGYILQGITLFNMDRNDEALECFREAERKAEKDSANLTEIYQEMAFTLSKLNRLDEALEYVEKGKQLAQTDKNEQEVLKGHLLLENGRLQEAQNCFMQALIHSESDPSIYLRVSISLYDNGYIILAYKMLKKLLDITPSTWTEGYALLAKCCHLLGKEEEFTSTLAKVSQLNPEDARSVLGDLFPAELSPTEYYDYYIQHNNTKK